MLEARYRVPPKPIPKGVEFKVIAYSQVKPYTLVRWRWRLKEAPSHRGELTEGQQMEGETLYRGNQTVHVEWINDVPLYQKKQIEKGGTAIAQSVWQRVDSQIGWKNVPMGVSQRLRNPSNITYLR